MSARTVVWRCPKCKNIYNIEAGSEQDMCDNCASTPVLKRRSWKEAYSDQQRERVIAQPENQIPVVTTDTMESESVSVREYLPVVSASRAYAMKALEDF